MRLQLTVEGLADVRQQLQGFSDRRFAWSVAAGITRTAVRAHQALRAELPRVFDRPTPYTISQARYTPARDDRLWSEVGFDITAVQDARGAVTGYRRTTDTPASKYLAPGVFGGPRNTKRFEAAMRAAGYLPSGWVAVPGPFAKLDAWGNVSRGQIVQILSQLRVSLTAGYNRDMANPDTARGAASVRAAIKKAGGRYFVRPVGGKGVKVPGVYLRDPFNRAGLMLVLLFVRSPVYSKRMDFDGLMQGVAQRHLGADIEAAIAASAARLNGGGR